MTLDHSVIAGNTGYDYGGGIDLYGNGATISFSTIADNRAVDGSGGAIYDESNDGPVTISNSTISNNYASDSGGGIYAEAAELWKITNSTISGNQAMNNSGNAGYGGGIYNGGATMSLANVTVTKNTAYDVSGIYAVAGSTTIKNSIVARNRDYGEDHWIDDCYDAAGLSSLGHNLFGDDGCESVASDLHGDALEQLSPGLNPLARNGGPTLTHALAPGSKAINHGQGCPKTDQRGHRRKGKCDIGAFER
jgi:predicted outer membrane repeat protein